LFLINESPRAVKYAETAESFDRILTIAIMVRKKYLVPE
jgi:hypothetical protein